MISTTVYRSRIVIDAYRDWVSKTDRVLDIGCGTAIVIDELRRYFKCQVVGTDLLDYRKREVPFKLMENENRLPFRDGEFDLAIFNDVLHHCSRQDDMLREASRVAKRVLIFEMKPTLVAKILDIFINQFYNRKMNIPLNLKSFDGWLEYFSRLGFSVESRHIPKPNLLYPFTHFSFRLQKS